MSAVALVLIGFGILLVVLGAHFIHTFYTRSWGNDELEWVGYGKHPFRK